MQPSSGTALLRTAVSVTHLIYIRNTELMGEHLTLHWIDIESSWMMDELL